jgi:Protein of unknown function with PCYCGC motif
MDTHGAAFPRREFLIGLLGFGSVGALGSATLPTVPSLMREMRVTLPPWATTSATTASAYRTAVLRPDLLAALPCFCGCATYVPAHRSLLDCFVHADGTFEPHAAGCSTCQEEALAARHLADRGLTPADVRRDIVATFGDRGPSTDMVM